MDMNLQKYMVFLKTAELGSFTKAAQALSYSQSGVSRMIADLEREWNVTLLERGHTGVRLTFDGVRLLPSVRRVCAEYQTLQTQIDELNGLQTGQIRIGAVPSVAAHWLPNMLHAFRKDYPKMDYELLLGSGAEIETWILERRVDCGFVCLPTQANLETVFLEHDPWLLVLPEKHPLLDRDGFSWEALCSYPFLLLEKGMESETGTTWESCHPAPNVQFTTRDVNTILSMIERGLGISILPRLLLKRTPYRVAVRDLETPAYRDIGVVFQNKRSASLAVNRFLDYLEYR